MSKDPAFLFYPGDYLRDTQCLSSNVQVAYDRIMCEHMRNICITQQQLNFFTKRLTDDEKDELMHVISKIRGGFQIKWVAESIEKRRKYSESRRKNREGKVKKDMIDISTSYVPHMENENEIVIENINGVEKIGFEQFWSAYDKGVVSEIPKCKKAWRELTPEEQEAAMEYIPGYIKSEPQKKFRKNPINYLLDRKWLDELEKPKKSKDDYIGDPSNYEKHKKTES